MSGVGSQTAEAKLIQIALTLRGWTVTDLARKAGITRNYTSLIIHGRRGTDGARRRIARALGMDVGRAFAQGEAKVKVEVERGRRGEIPRCARNDRGKGKE